MTVMAYEPPMGADAVEQAQRERVTDVAKDMMALRNAEYPVLEVINHYVSGRGDPLYIPRDAREEFRWVATRSRVNVLPLVVDTLAQSLFVDGYRTPGDKENAAAWDQWQANRMDARQTGVHRAALTYGLSFMLVLPGEAPTGEDMPAWSPFSPRQLTAAYADPINDEWPEYAITVRRGAKGLIIELIEAKYRHIFRASDVNETPRYVSTEEHGVPWCPVVRYLNQYDLDGISGEVAPLIPLQDQINLTTFNLLMASIFGAFRQKYVTGYEVQKDKDGRPQEPFKAAVNRLFVAESPDSKFGDFNATDLGQYIDARESSMRNLATIAQVPPNHLIGQMANLSAEALAAAEVQQTRKISERKALFGESHEQTLRLSDYIAGNKAAIRDTSAQVKWRDTEARSFAATVDALGKAATMLGIPPEQLWERIPGATQQDVEAWKEAAKEAPPQEPPAEMAGQQEPPAAMAEGTNQGS